MPAVSCAPVRTNTTVTSLRRTDDGYHVATNDGDFQCRCVVLASGACNLPSVPPLRDAVPASIEHFTPLNYRNPAQLPEGGVLVVGPSATGVQLAGEIHRSGRKVTLSRRRARPPAAHLSRTRCALVDGVVRRMGSAIRPDRRHHARAEAPVAAARWHS